ncbi:unnamed protein product [Phytophthora fragariaefolia]|uniref:Unnamed protein product n=1 Tax=Phytophthora fragariaefolia TaxID=1490495 RepID=A0A9W6Y494_9STRA|nr:unnamed protein product [Phytophthora fragariaefolia]
MKISSRSRALLGLVLTISPQQASGDATCKTLVDPSNILIDSVASWTNTDLSSIPFAVVFRELDAALPCLSKCAANFDPIAAFVSLATSDTIKSCGASAETVDKEAGWPEFCSIVDDTIVPCISVGMRESIMDTFYNAGGCCDDFLNQIQALFGDSLEMVVDKLAQRVANVVCAERTFTSLAGMSSKERCGYSIANSFTFINHENDEGILSLLNLAEIPNEQMCSAFAGEEFTNTEGNRISVGFGSSGVDTMGICLQPLDELASYLSSWPMFSEIVDANGTSIILGDLFAPDMSIRGDLLFSYFTTPTNLPAILMRVTESLSEITNAISMSANSIDSVDYSSSSDAYYIPGDLYNWYRWGSDSSDSSADWGSWSDAGNFEGSDGSGGDYSHGSGSWGGAGNFEGSSSGNWGNWGYADSSESSEGPSSPCIFFDAFLNLAVHIPVYGNCSYSDQSILLPFPIDTAY